MQEMSDMDFRRNKVMRFRSQVPIKNSQVY